LRVANADRSRRALADGIFLMSDVPPDSDLPALLGERLKHPLPGSRVQARYQPELSYGRHFGPAPSSARPAAVLMLLYPGTSGWCLPLTLRPDHLLDHAGQISLPGGSIEPGESSQLAALRELEEELGVAPAGIEMLGELSPIYLFRSNFLIQPWLAAMVACPAWRASATEVAELFHVSLAELRAPQATQLVPREHDGVTFRCPSFLWGRHAIWGATAMILAELVALADEVQPRGS
jgi:8-oxo-dGTP pyrophosphatase MutT (NUDIX family)